MLSIKRPSAAKRGGGGRLSLNPILVASGEKLILGRGRWCSLVGLIYQRELVSTQLALSVDQDDPMSESLEELDLGWVQTALSSLLLGFVSFRFL